MSRPRAADLLAGVRVLDLSIWRPGPYATQLLADLGADVVKVEPPGGDPMRVFPELFSTLNANKRSVVLNLRDPDELARAYELVAEADALVEGFRPGVAARLGLGETDVRARRPDLVYCSVSGYGQDGPLATVPGHDLNYQAYAGMLSPGGGEPVPCTVPVADLAGGLAAAMAVCAALLGRSRSGDGERVDVSMAELLATWTGPITHLTMASNDGPLDGLPTYGSFRTADDAWVTLGIIDEQHFWTRACEQLGLDDLRALDLVTRNRRAGEVRGRVAAAIRRRTRDDLLASLSADVPIAPALTRAEMLEHPQFVGRGLSGLATDEGYPAMRYPVRFEQHPARAPRRAPGLGEHQREGFRPRA